MLGTMWRSATRPPDAPPPSVVALTLDQLFAVDGIVPPGELRGILGAFIDALPSLGRDTGGRLGALFDKWISNQGTALHAAAASLARHYADHASAIRARAFAGINIGSLVPGSLFEAVFFDWIRAERPAVLKRGVAITPAVLFMSARQSGALRQSRELIVALMKLRDDTRTLAERVKPLGAVTILNLEHLPGALARMAGALDELLEPLIKSSGGLGERGRPEDPIRPLEIRILHELGLKNGDIGSLLEIKPDAVRKQLRKTKRRNGTPERSGGGPTTG